MIHYCSFVPPKKDDTQDLKKPAEDFRKFQAGNLDIEILISLFFRGFRESWDECKDCKEQFVGSWYDLYKYGISNDLIQAQFEAQGAVLDAYEILETA